jgi:hypothetical protein
MFYTNVIRGTADGKASTAGSIPGKVLTRGIPGPQRGFPRLDARRVFRGTNDRRIRLQTEAARIPQRLQKASGNYEEYWPRCTTFRRS